MSKLSDKDKGFIRLLMRSPDNGEGWRKVSNMLWPLVERFDAQELIERDDGMHMVRLSEKGQTVSEYLP